MAGRLDGCSNRGNIVDNARAGIDVGRQDGPDCAGSVLTQASSNLFRPDGAPPVSVEDFDLDAKPGRGLAPIKGKSAALQH